jgi:hypothetical protein
MFLSWDMNEFEVKELDGEDPPVDGCTWLDVRTSNLIGLGRGHESGRGSSSEVKREEVCIESCQGGMGEMCGFYIIE